MTYKTKLVFLFLSLYSLLGWALPCLTGVNEIKKAADEINLMHDVVYKGKEVSPSDPVAQMNVRILITYPGQQGPERCSGVVFDEKHILTAAHCIAKNGSEPTKVEVLYYDQSGKVISKNVKSIFRRTDFEQIGTIISPQMSMLDMAVLELGDVGPTGQKKPTAWNENSIPPQVSIMGRGVKDYATNPANGEVTKVFDNDQASQLRATDYQMTHDEKNNLVGVPRSTSYGCHGDSGGGVFGVGQNHGLYGVLSGVTEGIDKSRPCANSPSVRIAPLNANKDLIRSALSGQKSDRVLRIDLKN